MTMCLSETEYSVSSATYATAARPKPFPIQNAAASATMAMMAAAETAAWGESSPEAIGRLDFSGCSRSASRSRTSLMR